MKTQSAYRLLPPLLVLLSRQSDGLVSQNEPFQTTRKRVIYLVLSFSGANQALGLDKASADNDIALLCETGGKLTPEEALPGAYQNKCNSFPLRKIPVHLQHETVQLNIIQTEAAAGSTGLTVWNSSLLMCRLLQQIAKTQHDFFQGKTVVELGCGVGLNSLTAALLGARSVVATDRNPSVLDLTTRNIELNSLQSRVIARDISWGLLDAMEIADSAEIILGSDLTYNSGSWPALAETMVTVLKPEGYILYLSLGHPGFYVSSEIDGFLSVAKSKGLELVEPSSPQWPFKGETLEAMVTSALFPGEENIIQGTGGFRAILLKRRF